MEYLERVKLADYTSWRIGGEADFLCWPEGVEDVVAAVAWARDRGVPLHVLSGGSNVLISDAGVEGLVVALGRLSSLKVAEVSGEWIFEALAGTPKSELLKEMLKRKLEPALFLAGIPGDIGGGVAMNAGVSENIKPREFAEIVDAIEVVDRIRGDVRRVERSQLHFDYRHGSGWGDGIIVRVWLRWPHLPDSQILDRVRQANRSRLEKQPLHLPSCGSVFVNPEGHKAGRLISDAGLKGFQIGRAQVSDKHANFIVNLGGASARDTDAVIQHVQNVVLDKFGVKLKTEVRYLGRW